MRQAEFFAAREFQPIQLGPKHRIAFYPVAEAPLCPSCGVKMKKIRINARPYAGYFGFECPQYGCAARKRARQEYHAQSSLWEADERQESYWRLCYNAGAGEVKKVRIVYEALGRSRYGRPLYQPLATKMLPVGDATRRAVVVATLNATYLRGLQDARSVEAGELVCNIRRFAPIPIIREEYMRQIDQVFAKHGFQPYTPEGADWRRYNVYNYSEARIEAYYRNEDGVVLELRIPAQSETEKIDSWLIINAVVAVRTIRLPDVDGTFYVFPISERSPAFEMRIYSFVNDVPVPIEKAIRQLDKRLTEETATPVSREEAEQRAEQLLKGCVKSLPNKVSLQVTEGRRPFYLVKGQLREYMVLVSGGRGVDVYECVRGADGQPQQGEHICIEDTAAGSRLALHDRIVTRILALINDSTMRERISTLG